MIDKLFLKIRQRFRFSEEEEAMLREVITETADYDREGLIVPQNKPIGYSSVLLEGLTCRASWVESGERQIMEINLPGDFVDLHSYPLEWIDHEVTALTRCTIAKLYHDDITRMIERNPRLGRIFWFLTMLDASIHREWLVSIGKRTAVARLAHFFCEHYYRLKVVDLLEGDGYNFPIRQADIANALGLTPVHINRKLKDLREMGLCTFNEGRVRIHDLPALEQLAEFDTDFLFLESRTG